ncbi:MAG: hypothetical protein KAW52_02185 [candidate division Zixibacteria bacterium]|nr:hypothetical protein [candidate division Zixibacteria bacterium]
MHFIFGYQREVPVKIKRGTSKTTLVGLAILIILLLIFLSFENLDGSTCSPQDGKLLTSQSAFDGLVFFEMSDQVNSSGDLIDPFGDFSGLLNDGKRV